MRTFTLNFNWLINRKWYGCTEKIRARSEEEARTKVRAMTKYRNGNIYFEQG